MTKKKSRGGSEAIPGQSERLIRLRKALHYDTASGFAAYLGILQQRYSAFENGSPLSRDVVFRLIQKVPGLTSDWLYFGRPEGLSVDLARRLGEIGPAPGKRTTA
jgi:transcriptional regulator with XRE-family HTH domain